MAAALEAHIASIVFACGPVELMSQLSYMGGSLAEKELPDYRGGANAALGRFSEAAGPSAISSE